MPLDVAVQAPPNLAHAEFPRLLEAGIDDFGGVSPVTPDHVNPEAPWPERSLLAAATAAAGRTLAPRLRIYPRYLRDAERWLAPAVRGAALAASDGDGLARDEGTWFAGTSPEPPPAWQNGRRPRLAGAVSSPFARALERSERGAELSRGRRRGAAVRARPRGRAAGPRRRRAPRRALGRRRHLRRLPEHQLHQRLLLPLRVLRVLEGPAGRQPARPGLPAGRRRGRAALRRGLGSRRHGGLPAGRHPPRLHGHLVPRARARDPRGAARPARARVLAARGLAGRRDRGLGRCGTTSSSCATPGSAACRARRRRSSTTRCGACSAPTSCAPSSGSRSCAPRTPSACARRRRSCSGTSRRPSTRPATSSPSATCSARPAASPSSCRCRSCTRRRRSRSRAWRGTAPPSARPSCCTRPRAWCSTRT